MNRKTKTRRKKSRKKTVATENPEPSMSAESKSQVGSTGFKVFGLAFASLAMLWLSFPPIGLAWLAWVAPVPLIWLVQLETLPGRRPYRQLYFAGLLYWLGTFYFIPIPHPLLWIGWILVSLYMAVYTPVFVGVARTMVHRLGIPVFSAAPIVWTGIEWIRCNLATGMAMVCLSHTQYKSPIMIQVADLFGAYTLTFAMMAFAVGVATMLCMLICKFKPSTGDGSSSCKLEPFAIGVAIISISGVLYYGQFRLNEPIEYKNDSNLNIGLIQTSDDVLFRRLSEDEYMSQLVSKFEQTWEARKKWDDLDLVVWPESGFNPYADLISDNSEAETVEAIANVRTQVWSDAVGYPDFFPEPIPLLTGGGTIDPDNDRSYASAFLIANNGQIETRYYKNHLVMFGEYVPFAEWLPFIKNLSPIGGGISAGTEFETFNRNDVTIAPSICFETTIPHFIRRQINTLADAGNEPDVMVNLTNDGWFYGTSCLDLHLACNVFRAVEMRKPHLICANTGFSAEIDSCGRLLQTGPRRKPAVIRAEVRPIFRTSLYRQLGDLVPMLFGAIVVIAGFIGWLKRSSVP